MMKRVKIVVLLFVCVLFANASAQEKWSLQQCVEHVKEGNITLKIQRQITQDKLLIQRNAENAMLPSLSGGLGFSENFNQSGSSNGVYVNGNSFNAGLNIEASAILFNGFAIRNSIGRTNAEYEASELDLKSTENDVMLMVLRAYLDVLLKKEIVVVAEQQLAITQKEKEAVKFKYEFGEISRDVYLENLAQEAREQAVLDEARNNVTYGLLVLAHILDLEEPDNFDIVEIKIPELMAKVILYNTSELYKEVALYWPDIMSAEKQLESAEFVIGEARSGFYPTVSAFAGYSTNYYFFQGGGVSNPQFIDQIDLTSRPTLGLSVRIPIFSKFQNKNNVSRAKLNYTVKELQLVQVKNKLRETLKEAYVSAVASHSKFESAKKTLEATTESFRFAEEKYKVGALSPYDYNTAKSLLTKAESELVQAKYQFVFAARVLEFYKNNTVEL